MLEEGGSLPEGPSVDNPAPRLRLGDQLLSPRRFITHHGIYVGNGKVIHYAGLASGLQAGPVKVSPLKDFLADHPYKVREYETRTYSREESVEMAWGRVGEDLYHAAFNNCERFVTWCITGKTRSVQVDLLFGLTGGPWGLLFSRSGRRCTRFTEGSAPVSEDYIAQHGDPGGMQTTRSEHCRGHIDRSGCR